ncbi:MAG: Maf family protein [Candidatus Peribacteraceae bacterium]|nr:Maf family protein [Candidatus Peribacteraceae bacterium]
MPHLILASASPQRKTLLRGLDIQFDVIPSSIEEDDHPEADPAKRAADLARLKAQDIAANHSGSIVIGCDTLVVAPDGTLLEKPRSIDEVRSMLTLQSGGTSLVHSALCVIDAKGKLHEGLSSSSVRFKKLTSRDIDWWIGTKLWQGRSGGFQIDGLGQLMIERIEGDWTGVVGLPVFLLGQLLKEAGAGVE